ncbi:MAG: TolC family protein [Vicinamibacteria bacterium]|nr:TolC family protein [Vicinamibacteria bacterium]
MPIWFLLLLAQAPAEPPPSPAGPPRHAVGEALTLTDAVALARAHSPLAAAARAQAEGAERAAKAAGRLADPTLELVAENWRSGDESFVAGTDLDLFAVVTQPLDLFTRGGRKAQARGESEEAAAERRRAEQDVELATVRRYLEVWRGRELLAALDAQAGNLKDIVTAMERRVGEGYAAEADLLRFRAEGARAANQLARARIEQQRAEAELAFLVGRPVEGLRVVRPDLPPPPGGDPEALAEQALARRPDVAAARARAARARGTMSLERARRHPELALSGGYKRTAGLDTVVVGVVTTVPVFDRNGRAVARAEADARAAELDLQAMLDRARAEAAILVRAARELELRLARLDDDLVRPAEEARRSALAAFREGASDVLRVVDAERTNTEARREALDLTVEAFLASGRARLAAGLEVLP